MESKAMTQRRRTWAGGIFQQGTLLLKYCDKPALTFHQKRQTTFSVRNQETSVTNVGSGREFSWKSHKVSENDSLKEISKSWPLEVIARRFFTPTCAHCGSPC